MKIAIIQDALVVSGGAERVAVALSQAFPEADFFTSVYLPEQTFSYFKKIQIHTLPGAFFIKNERQFKRFYILWFIGFFFLDLSKYDLVLSSSTYLAKFIRKPQKGIHICYLHSPFRFLWKRHAYESTSLPFNKSLISIFDLFQPILQYFDKKATRSIDIIISNSKNMSDFIFQTYGIRTEIVYPPINYKSFYSKNKRKDYFLYVGRLVSYKRVDLAIEACKLMNKRLLIVGDGPEYSSLKKKGNENIEFLGVVNEEVLLQLYSEAKGFFFPGLEDFGLVSIEAQASGCPVIAYRAGGALETVLEDITGVFFEQQNIESLINTMKHFDSLNFDFATIRKNSQMYDIQIFVESIKSIVKSIYTKIN